MLAAVVLSFPGCEFIPKKEIAPESALSLPSKDDVALIDGKPLTIGAFLAIRSVTTAETSKETIVWLGLATIAIQNDARSRGRDVTPSIALSLAKFAVGQRPRDRVAAEIRAYQGEKAVTPDPVTFKSEVDALLSRAEIKKNDQALADLK